METPAAQYFSTLQYWKFENTISAQVEVFLNVPSTAQHLRCKRLMKYILAANMHTRVIGSGTGALYQMFQMKFLWHASGSGDEYSLIP